MGDLFCLVWDPFFKKKTNSKTILHLQESTDGFLFSMAGGARETLGEREEVEDDEVIFTITILLRFFSRGYKKNKDKKEEEEEDLIDLSRGLDVSFSSGPAGGALTVARLQVQSIQNDLFKQPLVMS